MLNTRKEFGSVVRVLRKKEGLTQQQLADKIKSNRSSIAHLEQGRRLPSPDDLEKICNLLGVDRVEWGHFADEHSSICVDFEVILEDLTGRTLSLHYIGRESRNEAEKNISIFFKKTMSESQRLDLLNRILVSYGVRKISKNFYNSFFKDSLSSVSEFSSAVSNYQKIAIRLFSTFFEAYITLNSTSNIEKYLNFIEAKDITEYKLRDEWTAIKSIPNEQLELLGYIAVEKLKAETKERNFLFLELNKIADEISKEGLAYIQQISEKKKTKIDTLLRKFDANFEHGIFSSLFAPDSDEMRREAERLRPKDEYELAQMQNIQSIALSNLSNYLTADYMDVYVATSMRNYGDFVSVNRFVNSLFEIPKVKELNLRYFNPTQSWIEDRVAKGIVEALMLKRSSVTIYMAQKTDTFGKDSEASVALGQGKTVIVYVPKLNFENIDSEKYYSMNKAKLITLCKENNITDIDEDADAPILAAKIIFHKINELNQIDFCNMIRATWDDFDLFGESHRIKEGDRELYRRWLDDVIGNEDICEIPDKIRAGVESIIISLTINFEKRSKVFKEVHPLALQVILSSGVLNGILVVRSIKQCSYILSGLINNNLDYKLIKDDENYRLVEKETESTIRVISRNKLIRNAFGAFYRRNNDS